VLFGLSLSSSSYEDLSRLSPVDNFHLDTKATIAATATTTTTMTIGGAISLASEDPEDPEDPAFPEMLPVLTRIGASSITSYVAIGEAML
jgi:hypothetical protein